MSTIDLESSEGKQEALKRMVTLRRFEQAVVENFLDGEIPGFIHPYIGEEAIAVGALGALEQDDYATSTHRGHGHALAKGLDPDRVMAELYGKSDGYCKGKGGSMHIASADDAFMGTNGIVAAGIPLATGAGLSLQYQDRDQVAITFFGDGALTHGTAHEGMNMGATWELPVIYLIENNFYAEGVPLDTQHNIETLSDHAQAYDIPGITIDGNDVMAVYEAVSEARSRARNGEGPTLIEAETYRYQGHFVGDEEAYRSDEEVEEWKNEHDPIDRFKDKLIDSGELTDDEFEAIETEVDETIESALDFARQSPKPDLSEAYADMYSESVPEIQHFAKQTRADGGSANGGVDK